MNWRKLLLFVGLPVIAILVSLYIFAQYDADFLWFQHLGFGDVFTTILWAKVATFTAFFLIFVLAGGVNTYIARKGGAKAPSARADVVRSPVGAIENLFNDKREIYIWAFFLLSATIFWPKLLVITSIIFMICIIILAHGHLAHKKQDKVESIEEGMSEPVPSSSDILRFEKRLSYLWVIFALLLSGIMGMRASNAWLTFLMFIHQSQFGVAEPIFSKDAGFYVYSLPVYYFFIRWCSLSLLLMIGTVVLSYYLDQAIHGLSSTCRFWADWPR